MRPPWRLWGALIVVVTTIGCVDRLARGGAVVDFLNVGFGRLRTGIFNVADLAIMLGVLLVLFEHRRSRPAPAPQG